MKHLEKILFYAVIALAKAGYGSDRINAIVNKAHEHVNSFYGRKTAFSARSRKLLKPSKYVISK